MGGFNKFMMFLLGVVAVVVALAMLLLGSGVISQEAVDALSGPQWYMTEMIIGAVIIVIGAVALIMAFSGQARPASASSAGSRRAGASGEFITIPANSGDIRVSFETIKSLAERASSTVEEIKTANITVGKKEDNLYLALDVAAAPDTNIPEAVERLQKAVKDYIESTISLSIGDINVHVSGINSTYRKRTDSYQS